MQGGEPLAEIERRIAALEQTRRIWPSYPLPTAPRDGVVSGLAVGTTPTMRDIWVAEVPEIIGPALDLIVFVSLTPLTVAGTIEMALTDQDGTVTSGSVAIPITGGTGFYFVYGQWLHGARLWNGPAAVALRARMDSGSYPDVFFVYRPTKFAITDPEGATVTGDLVANPYP